MNPTLWRFFIREFRKRRKKAALITFALFWGTLSILMLLAFGQGMSAQFRISFSGLGQDLVMISGGQTSQVYQGLPKGRRIRLYPEDIPFLEERIPEIASIAPEAYNNYQVSARGREINRTVHGTTTYHLCMAPPSGGLTAKQAAPVKDLPVRLRSHSPVYPSLFPQRFFHKSDMGRRGNLNMRT